MVTVTYESGRLQEFKSQFKPGFTKVAVTRAGCLHEWICEMFHYFLQPVFLCVTCVCPPFRRYQGAFSMNCIAYRDPRKELFNTLKKETNLFLGSMTPSSAFATLISMKQGEKTQKIVAKYM